MDAEWAAWGKKYGIKNMKVDQNQEEDGVVTKEDRLKALSINELRNLGKAWFQFKEYERALKLYTFAIELFHNEPETAPCYGDRAACYICLGKYKEALEDNEIAMKLDPTYSIGIPRMLRCKTMLGDWAGCHQLISDHEDTVINPLLVDEMERFYTILRQKNEGEEAYQKGEYRTTIFYMEQLEMKGFHSAECKALKARAQDQEKIQSIGQTPARSSSRAAT